MVGTSTLPFHPLPYASSGTEISAAKVPPSVRLTSVFPSTATTPADTRERVVSEAFPSSMTPVVSTDVNLPVDAVVFPIAHGADILAVRFDGVVALTLSVPVTVSASVASSVIKPACPVVAFCPLA